MFPVFEIMAFEHVAINSLNYGKNTSDRQSTCYQTVQRFQIWLKEKFSNSISPLIRQNYDKSPAVQISTVSGTREHIDSRRVLLNRSFRAFTSTHFWDSITSQIIKLWTWPFFWKSAKFCIESKNIIKIPENVSYFWVNGLWRYCTKLSQLLQEYLWPALDVSTNSTEISDLTETDLF